MMDNEQLIRRHVENLIGDIVDKHAQHFGREDWQAIFGVVLSGMYGDGSEEQEDR